ncbi:RHS repeat-associated core domain-containing protein [Massilia sp. TSP1-1-2]|uniref:RHS repeat-associated core domain-containing protein n=1 Tax=Massilia sp. TSP1-1-2 TaxID=2804649 RepID=UPI003CE8BA06
MVRENLQWFGDTTPGVAITVQAPPALVDNAQFVSQVPPPSVLTQGQSYSYSVTMRNVGTTTWTSGGANPYRLGSANLLDNTTWGTARIELASTVLPGGVGTFNFTATVPATASSGLANFQWRMVHEMVQWFGENTPNVVITIQRPQLPGRVEYIHTDGLGSPVARTDQNGGIISRTRYEPYGYTAAGAVPTIGFTGHVNDSETGLVYMQQRYYDPVAGRFLSIDPVTTDAENGSSFNRYAYANNSPYKYVDPDGREPTPIGERESMLKLQAAAAAAETRPALSYMHSESVLKNSSGSYSSLKKESTEKIVSSLKPGAKEPLRVAADGKIFDGNTRVLVLQERGVNVNQLPRTPHARGGTGGSAFGLLFVVGMVVELSEAIQKLPQQAPVTAAAPPPPPRPPPPPDPVSGNK